MKQALFLAAACVGIMSCAGGSGAPPTPADAKTFLDTVNDTMKRLGIEQGRAGWVQQTFITDDTEAIAARANQEFIDATARFAKEATKFDKVTVPAEQRRQLRTDRFARKIEVGREADFRLANLCVAALSAPAAQRAARAFPRRS